MKRNINIDTLRCPHCAGTREGRLSRVGEEWLACQEPSCSGRYPVADGVPIMLTEDGDFLGLRARIVKQRHGSGING